VVCFREAVEGLFDVGRGGGAGKGEDGVVVLAGRVT